MMLCYQLNNYSDNNIKASSMQIKSLLDSFCNIPNDDIIKSNFSLIFVNNGGKLNIYILLEETVKQMLLKKLKFIYPDIDFLNEDVKNIKSIFNENSKFQKIKLKYRDENKRPYSDEPQIIFMENLINSIYSKDTEESAIVIINLNPISNVENDMKKNESNGKKIAKHILNTSKFLLECINYSEDKKTDKTIKDEKELVEDIKYNYMVSIYVGVSTLKQNNNIELIRKLRLITSTFSQLNKSNMYLAETSNLNEAFSNSYNIKLNTSEIYQFVFLPDDNILSDVLGGSDTKVVYDKGVPREGLYIGNQCDNTIPICIATPEDKITLSNYKNIYLKSSQIITSLQDLNNKTKERFIKNSNIIDNFCKSSLIMGLPGTGKSEFINTKAINGLKCGIPFILIDPKYDTQKRLIESIPDEYIDKVDFLDLGDMLYPPALNIFRKRKENDVTENSLITTSFLSYMRKQFERNWGYNIERMLQMTTDAILLDDVSTMSEFYWMLSEEVYRKIIIEIIKSKLEEKECDNKARLKQLLRYWQDYQARFEKNPITVNKEIETVMNKIGVFIGNRFINAIVSQRNSFDFKAAGDMGRSVIINLPEGIISRDNMSLLAGFVNKAIWADYQSRDDMEMNERIPVQWLIDEAHTIIDDEFVGILQKSRSRRLGLTIITQTLASLDLRGDKISSIVADNCKTKLIFKIGYGDAKNLIEDFSPLQTSDLTNCQDYHYYGKLLLPDGKVSKPFFAKAPDMAPVLRNYDDYKRTHRSGKMKINEIEDDIEDRLDKYKVLYELQM